MSSSSSASTNEMINTESINSGIIGCGSEYETTRGSSDCAATMNDVEIIEDVPYREEERSLLEKTLKCVDETKVNFRFKGKKVFLTYPGHLNKQEYKDWIRGRFSSHELNIVIAHEGADSATNYNHSHVLIQSNKDMDVKNVRGFDYESDADDNPHPNIQKIAGKLHLKNIYKYLCKEDKSNLFLLRDEVVQKEISMCDKIWECETIQEAYRMYGGKGKGKCSPMEINSYWDKKPEPEGPPEEPLVLKNWMKALWGELSKEHQNPNRRSVNGVRGRVGGEGKSDFADEIIRKYPKQWRYIEEPPETGWPGLVKIMIKWAKEGWDKTGIIIDIPRDAGEKAYAGLPRILENLKNGAWTTPAYESAQKKGNKHIIVLFMCNRFPKLKSLSLDRWKLYDLISDPDNEREYHLQRLILKKPGVSKVDDLRAKRLARGQVAQTTFYGLEERPYEPIYEPGEFIEPTDDTI